ncbi:MAG: methyltransferase domain-containing protein [Planctomycetota bacterium]|jgi:trans-aconitate methyltransferase
MAHEFDGAKYEQASPFQREWGRKLIAELGLEGNESVLDLGCGDGGLTAQITELVPNGEVLGVDASEGMISAARAKERENLSFRRLDIDDLDYVDRFDVVFSNASLHWVKDHKRLFENIGRSLREGGRVRLNFAGDGNCPHLIAVLREAMALEQFAEYFTDFEWPWYMPALDEYEALASSSGLRDVRVWGEKGDLYFDDVEAMVRWLDQPCLVPFLACIRDVDKEPFRSFVIRRMTEETKQKDGRCFGVFRRINVFAVK